MIVSFMEKCYNTHQMLVCSCELSVGKLADGGST